MFAEREENQIFLRGYAAESPRFSHESHGIKYHTFPLSVPRLSGATDVLNVLAPESVFAPLGLGEGTPTEVCGEVRSFNNRSGVGNRLVISVFARSVELCDGPPANSLSLSGALCRPPNLRHTPLGRDICDILLAVNRRYGRSDYLPCIVWGSLAVACSTLSVGDRIRLEGRLQSRIYHKEENGISIPHTAFEISAMSMAPDDEQ